MNTKPRRLSIAILYVLGLSVLCTHLNLLITVVGQPINESSRRGEQNLQPKVFIISMFQPEGDIWHNIPEFDILAQNLTIPGFSPLYPSAHCTSSGSICQLITGEAEINAASTISSLIHSPLFNLTQTYFLIAGIAGINPNVATIGDVTFARYAVQVALQYELDAREIPLGFPTGYIPQGSSAPGQYPTSIYGTEVFELNTDLRSVAVQLARNATLLDTPAAAQLRSLYPSPTPAFPSSANGPSIVECDTATSDVYFSGTLLSSAFENTTTLLTNGTGIYCSAQQEDNATLEVLLRATSAGLVDFSRIILMRSASDFDRPHPGQTAADNLFGPTPGYDPSLWNLYLAGVKVVEGIVNGWEATFQTGIAPTNYIGDIFGSLGGEPDFGPGSVFAKRSASLGRRTSRTTS